MTSLRERLASATPILMDGAMGTQLIARGLELPEPTVRWNLTRPTEVRAVHESFILAGAEILVTNTFGGHGDEHVLAVQAGVAIARAAAGELPVLGDAGPGPGIRLLIRLLADAGVDGLLLESLHTEREVAAALEAAAAEAPKLPVLVSAFFLGHDDVLTAERLGELASGYGAAAVGINCTESPNPLSQAWRGLAPCGLPRFVRAGIVPARSTAPPTWARDVLAAAAGARLLGGCCGTTPAHIAALNAALKGTR